MKNTYTRGQAAQLLGIHKDTLLRYERCGFIVPERLKSREARVYLLSQLEELCARVRLEQGKGKWYIDKLPRIRHKAVRCATCGWEWDKGKLIRGMCPKCRDRGVIHNASVAQ